MIEAAPHDRIPTAVDRSAYPFRGRRLDLGAGGMHYLDEGEGEPLLFVHGTPTWSFDWRHLIGGFGRTHRCIAPDLIGFGLSERPAGFPYTPEAHADALDEFVERLDLEPFTLVVHDFGGPIGLPLCLKRPDKVRRLVLFNTWMWSLAGDAQMERAGKIIDSRLGRFLYERMNLSLRVLMPRSYADRKKLTPAVHRQHIERFVDRRSRGTVLWCLARALLGSSAYYDSLWQQRGMLLGRPALVLWGMKDPFFTPRLLEHWRHALPDARIVELEDAGHWPHEEAPERVTDELREFLSTSAVDITHGG